MKKFNIGDHYQGDYIEYWVNENSIRFCLTEKFIDILEMERSVRLKEYNEQNKNKYNNFAFEQVLNSLASTLKLFPLERVLPNWLLLVMGYKDLILVDTDCLIIEDLVSIDLNRIEFKNDVTIFKLYCPFFNLKENLSDFIHKLLLGESVYLNIYDINKIVWSNHE